MLTALLYLFDALVLVALGVKSHSSYKKSSLNIVAKRFIGIGFITAAAYALFIVDIYFESIGQSYISAKFNTLGVLFFFFSMMFAAMMAGDLMNRQALSRKVVWALTILAGFVTALNFQSEHSTIITPTGLVTYHGVPLSTEIFSISVLVIYTWAFFNFIHAGIKNRHIRLKLFLLGIGFLVSTWSGAALIVADTFNEYLITYSILSFGYILQLAGIMTSTSPQKPRSNK